MPQSYKNQFPLAMIEADLVANLVTYLYKIDFTALLNQKMLQDELSYA